MQTSSWQRLPPRTGLIAWLLVTALLVLFGAAPQASASSIMQLHGALHRDGSVSIVSHRGAAALAPENTLAAMRVAIDQGVDFVETDVQLTSDGVPVLLHDLTLDRTTNGNGPVAMRDFAYVRSLDAGSWFDAAHAGEQVPTLEEFLDVLETANVRALVELKGEWTSEQLAAVGDLLQSRYMVNRVALQSFDEATLRGLQEIAPQFARVMLTREWDEAMVQLARELEVSAVGGRPKLIDRDRSLLGDLRSAGIGSLAYTLNKPGRWDRAIERGIDLIVTDDPVHLGSWRSDLEAAAIEGAEV
ncbi:glycerophosphodiester phosphodiesterase [Leucobacter sp. HY1910]